MTPQQTLDTVCGAIDARNNTDPYRWIREATDTHRHQHRCWAYPYADGTVLGAITAALRPGRALELGAALGYTACWWATRGAQVDTIEGDPVHVHLARENIKQAGPAGTVTVHEGDFADVMLRLGGPYDLAFFDGYEPPKTLLEQMSALLTGEGVLVTTNLDLGAGRFRSILTANPAWTTCYIADLAISVRVERAHQ